jgi:hypothetical protein
MSLSRRLFRAAAPPAAFLFACYGLQGCLFSWGGHGEGAEISVEEKNPHTGRGYYTFDRPAAATRMHLDSTHTVRWRASDSAVQGPVWLSLYWNEEILVPIQVSLTASGSFDWSPGAMGNLGEYRLGSGSEYRFRIESEADTSKWDFSPRFTLYSNYAGSLQLTVPAQGAQAGGDSALRIAWTLSGEVGSLVGLQLYQDSILVHTIDLSAPAAGGEYSWSAMPEWLRSGSGYRIRIFSMSDASIGQMGPAFTINIPARIGGYEFIRPQAGDIWEAGGVGEVEWKVTGNPGSYSGLTLWRDSPREVVWGWTPGDSHNSVRQVNIPSDLPSDLPNGIYRMRIGSLADTTLFAFSPAFTIQGIGDP